MSIEKKDIYPTSTATKPLSQGQWPQSHDLKKTIELTPQQLLQRAWDQLKLHENLHYSNALKFTKNPENAKDLVQEMYLIVLININKFRTWSNFKAWTFIIMRNTFINGYRKKQTSSWYLVPMQNGPENSVATKEIDPNSALAHEELMKIVTSFDENSSIPFLMIQDWFSYAEIAEYLETPEGTVKSRVHFFRKKVQARLAEVWITGVNLE